MIGNGLDKGPETPISIDVINHYRAAWPQRLPCQTELKVNIALRMEAIVDKKVDLANPGE